jgi:hypothetical protein
MLSSLIKNPPAPSAVFIPPPPSLPPSKKCGFDGLIDTNQKIITAINELIQKYNSCNNECKLEECNNKYKSLIQAIELNYQKLRHMYINNNITELLESDFTFNQDYSKAHIFEIFLEFLNKNFQSQTKENKIKFLIILKAIIGKKGGNRKSRRSRKQRKNKSKTKRYIK